MAENNRRYTIASEFDDSDILLHTEETSLPGFRFHPTDEELVGFYLRRKVETKPISIEIIKEMDIYKYDPWDLPTFNAYGVRNSTNKRPGSLRRGSTSGTRSHFRSSQASLDGYRWWTPSDVLRRSADPQSGNFPYDPSTMNMGTIVTRARARETISNETSMPAYTSRGRRPLNRFSIMHIPHHNFEAGTQHHTRRTLPYQHNIHLDGANTRHDFMLMPFCDTPLEHDGISINMIDTNLNYSTSTQSHTQRSIASSHGNSHRPYHDSLSINLGNFVGAYAEPYPQRSLASHQNPAGRVRAFPAMDLNHSTDTLSQYHISMALHGNSPDSEREFNDMSNSLPNYAASIQSQTQRPAASLNNPPGHDGAIIFPSDGEFMNVPRTIHAEARATSDDETAGHSKLFKTLVTVNFTNAYKAAKILMSTYHSVLPLSIKIFGFLTVGFAVAAVFSSLAGLSLSTFRPNTLPFGCNPQVMIRMMHNVVVHTTAYAFIGTMCHEFLQDDPSIMWIVAGLASAVFMTVMIFIGRRR